MITNLWSIFDDRSEHVRGKVVAVYALLVAANVAGWGWALVAFHDFPVLLGTAMLAYAFGLRHAFDADHIAAIDNVTRKLMQEEKRPVAVGLFFSLGHSTHRRRAFACYRADDDGAPRQVRRLQDGRRHGRHLGLRAVPVRYRHRQHPRPDLDL